MSADEDYPSELDLTGSSQEAEKVEEDEGLCVGPPPGSDFGSSESDYYENSDENRDFYETNDEYGSGEDDFDIEAYFGETQPVFPPLESLNDENGKREDAVEIQETFQEVDETGKEIMRVTLTAALSAGVEFLENGFEPEDINKCLTDIGYCLESLTIILMGSQEFMKDMPQLSSLEYCHVLVKEGWLRKGENGKFFAIFPDTDEYYVTSLIRGNEKLREMETTRKQKAEIYESEEEELRVLRSFNLIAELLHAVRNDYQQKKIRYGIFANEYNLMVKQKKYPAIYEKYSKFLPLDPEKPWNSVWFNAHCKRSSLQKFVRMSRFSEIIVNDQQPTEVYFRADMEPENRKLFFF
uniref:SH2 domain-containing protein n=1 Tax=Caenorhabditis tropicalis TaxID=1561998 RepID=A0A1I7UNM3_9PELO